MVKWLVRWLIEWAIRNDPVLKGKVDGLVADVVAELKLEADALRKRLEVVEHERDLIRQDKHEASKCWHEAATRVGLLDEAWGRQIPMVFAEEIERLRDRVRELEHQNSIGSGGIVGEMSKGTDIPVFLYADPSEFCPRHEGNSVVRRCHHFGKFYVSEMRLSKFGYHRPVRDGGYIDYVHDVEPNWLLEGHRFETSEEGQRLWEEAVRRMLVGDLPDKERET